MDKMKPILFFDLDGTLADTAPDILTSAVEAFQRENIAIDIDDVVRKSAGKGRLALMRAALKQEIADERLEEKVAQHFAEIYAQRMYDTTVLYPGVEELLEYLTKGQYTWGIITNKYSDTGEPLLQWLGLWDKASCVVFGDTLERGKPAPDPLLHACQQLHCAPRDCVMVGDTENDVLAGNAAGMTTIAVKHTYDEKAIMAWGPDIILAQTSDVLQWFDNVELARA